MKKYADYFFSEPWPEKYDYDEATDFTDEDVEFLTDGEEGEYKDRLTTVFLKKNINLEDGFAGVFGYFWTQQAFHEEFVRPRYKPVQEAFDHLREGDAGPRSVLDELKGRFDVRLIHDSLIDLVEHGVYMPTGRLIASMLELLHEEEGLPPCHDRRCEYERERLHADRRQGGYGTAPE